METQLINAKWTYGIQHKNFSASFLEYIQKHNFTYPKLLLLLETAVGEDRLSYDGDALTLYVYNEDEDTTTEVWFDAIYFQDAVGDQYLDFDHQIDANGGLPDIPAQEYLTERWEDEAANFIINNIFRAQVKYHD